MKRWIGVLAALLLLCPCFDTAAYESSAAGCAVVDAATGRVLYENNGHARLPMASTTKIMTAYLLCLEDDLNTVVPVTPAMVGVEGSSMYLKVGETPTKRDLLYGLLLASGNDAAQAVAIALGGSTENFVQIMNDTAAAMGLHDTHFNTPSGLDGDTHYTSACDLAQLTIQALALPAFREVCGTKTITLRYGQTTQTLTNHNRLLRGDERFIGVKTGYTDKAGRCLVSAATENGHTVVCVTLRDPDDWADHTAMAGQALEALQAQICVVDGQQFSVPLADQRENAVLTAVGSVELHGVEAVSVRYELPRFVYAPVNTGDVIGQAVYCYNDQIVAMMPIVAQNDAKTAVGSRFQTYKRNLAALLAAF